MQTTLCPFVCSCRRRRCRAVRPTRLVHANQATGILRIATFSVNASFCCESFQEIRGPGAITPAPAFYLPFVDLRAAPFILGDRRDECMNE